jgi:hypothetical protein
MFSSSIREGRYRQIPLLMAAALVLCLWACACMGEEAVERGASFERPERTKVKAITLEIASEPRFRTHKTFTQWLSEKLGRWKMPGLGLSPLWASIIIYIVILWCLLTLVAILIHLGWTAYIFFGGRPKPATASAGKKAAEIAALSYEELLARARLLAGEGAFAEAIGMTMAALLKWLDSMKIIAFHQSKTNGDYLREYAGSDVSRKSFGSFVLAFDRTIYGRHGEGRQAYQEMKTLMESVQNGVSPKL